MKTYHHSPCCWQRRAARRRTQRSVPHHNPVILHSVQTSPRTDRRDTTAGRQSPWYQSAPSVSSSQRTSRVRCTSMWTRHAFYSIVLNSPVRYVVLACRHREPLGPGSRAAPARRPSGARPWPSPYTRVGYVRQTQRSSSELKRLTVYWAVTN